MISYTLKNAMAYYVQRLRCSCKLRRRIGPRISLIFLMPCIMSGLHLGTAVDAMTKAIAVMYRFSATMNIHR
jgi:hypothetical protein